MQRCQGRGIVGSHQFLWLQHPDFCSSCQSSGQIPHRYEGMIKENIHRDNVYFQLTRISYKLAFLIYSIHPVTDYDSTDLFWHRFMGCWLTYHYCGVLTGAAQTLALHWSLLSPHCSQNGWGRVQYLTHPWTHSHQPKQVHRLWPLSYGEDHLREAQPGAQSRHSLNLYTPLPLSLHIFVHRKVNGWFSFTYVKNVMTDAFIPVRMAWVK